MRLLEHYHLAVAGRECVVVGRSQIVGKPMASLLLNANGTVTLCHSKTADLRAVTRRAEILVVGIGQPKMVDATYIRPGAVVIDVGISKVDGELVGDVDFNSASAVAGWITPVPGGVGPMTVACLLENALTCCRGLIGERT
jgi:methylenetetrahydrofolate dehydrogenase (NADP+)/methenyltetrahydrofolate cyclohydrolase